MPFFWKCNESKEVPFVQGYHMVPHYFSHMAKWLHFLNLPEYNKIKQLTYNEFHLPAPLGCTDIGLDLNSSEKFLAPYFTRIDSLKSSTKMSKSIL